MLLYTSLVAYETNRFLCHRYQSCSVEGIYFPSWKISERCHWEQGHTKPALPAVQGSLWPALTAGTASGNSKHWVCSHGTMHSKGWHTAMWKTRSTWGNVRSTGLVFVIICTQGMKFSGTWPVEKSPQKETPPCLTGENTEPWITGGFKRPSSFLWVNERDGLEDESYALFQWSWLVDQPLENKAIVTMNLFPYMGSLLRSWQGNHWMAEQV